MSNGGPRNMGWGPGGGPASPAQLIGPTIDKKGANQALRRIYENRTKQSAVPGHGPANLIRSFAGISVPKGAKGGSKTRRLRKKSKKTRGRR